MTSYRTVSKIAAVLLLIMISQMFLLTALADTSSFGDIAAASALLVERDNGIILYESEIFKRHPADALTKVMTLYLAAEAIDKLRITESDVIEMTEEAWEDLEGGNTTQSIMPGQKMTFLDLMYSAYTGGSDEACNMIALRVAGNIEAFVAMMNEKAAELGCNDTHFVNPHGRYDEQQYTCAYDIYLIYNAALNNDYFNEISGTYRRLTIQTDETESRSLISSNSLMNQGSSYYYRYCLTGIATRVGGSSYEGGYSMVSSAEEDGLTLIAVVLGGRDIINADQSVTLMHFSETNRLYLWGYENFGWRDILKTSTLLAKIPVLYGNGADFINVRPDRPYSMLLETAIPTSDFILDIVIYSEQDGIPLVAPISAGDVLGEVTITRDGIIYDTIPLVANTSIEISPLEIARREITAIPRIPLVRHAITVLIVVFAIYLILVIRYNVIRINRLRRIRNAKKEIIREKHNTESNDGQQPEDG